MILGGKWQAFCQDIAHEWTKDIDHSDVGMLKERIAADLFDRVDDSITETQKEFRPDVEDLKNGKNLRMEGTDESGN